MNPLPSRPLLNNPTAPLSLPNVPSFDQIGYNSRPRKVLETGKEFPLLNGMHSSPNLTAPPGSASTLGQLPSMERSHNIPGIGQQQPSMPQLQSQTPAQTQPSSNLIGQSEKDPEAENRQVPAIFGADDIGEWKEKPRFTLEPPEKSSSRLARDFQPVTPAESGGWDGRDEDDPKEEEGEVEDEEASLVGDGESTKVWKAKRTLRKWVYL